MSQMTSNKYATWVRIILPTLVLAAIIFGIRSWFLQIRANSCYFVEKLRSEAPNKIHVAVVSEQICDAPLAATTNLVVAMQVIPSPPGEKGVDFFITRAAFPILSWKDSQHLVVTISDIGWIGTSLHEAAGAQIEYRLAAGLAEAQIKQRIAERNERVLADIRRHPSPPGQPGNALVALKLANEAQQENLDKFKTWVRVNIAGAYEEFEKHGSE
jgi:hypothetical protein